MCPRTHRFKPSLWLLQDINEGTHFALTRSSGREPDVPLKVLSNLDEFVTMCVYMREDKTYCEHGFLGKLLSEN